MGGSEPGGSDSNSSEGSSGLSEVGNLQDLTQSNSSSPPESLPAQQDPSDSSTTPPSDTASHQAGSNQDTKSVEIDTSTRASSSEAKPTQVAAAETKVRPLPRDNQGAPPVADRREDSFDASQLPKDYTTRLLKFLYPVVLRLLIEAPNQFHKTLLALGSDVAELAQSLNAILFSQVNADIRKIGQETELVSVDTILSKKRITPKQIEGLNHWIESLNRFTRLTPQETQVRNALVQLAQSPHLDTDSSTATGYAFYHSLLGPHSRKLLRVRTNQPEGLPPNFGEMGSGIIKDEKLRRYLSSIANLGEAVGHRLFSVPYLCESKQGPSRPVVMSDNSPEIERDDDLSKLPKLVPEGLPGTLDIVRLAAGEANVWSHYDQGTSSQPKNPRLRKKVYVLVDTSQSMQSKVPIRNAVLAASMDLQEKLRIRDGSTNEYVIIPFDNQVGTPELIRGQAQVRQFFDRMHKFPIGAELGTSIEDGIAYVFKDIAQTRKKSAFSVVNIVVITDGADDVHSSVIMKAAGELPKLKINIAALLIQQSNESLENALTALKDSSLDVSTYYHNITELDETWEGVTEGIRLSGAASPAALSLFKALEQLKSSTEKEKSKPMLRWEARENVERQRVPKEAIEGFGSFFRSGWYRRLEQGKRRAFQEQYLKHLYGTGNPEKLNQLDLLDFERRTLNLPRG